MKFQSIIKPLLFTLIAGLFFTHCENTALQTEVPADDTSADPGTASMQFIHSASSMAELDIIYRENNGSYYLLESETQYGHQYGFYDFSVRDLELLIAPANTNISVCEDIVPLKQDEKYTVIARDYDATIAPDLVTLKDTLYTADPGYALVRFVHLASGLNEVQIVELGGQQLARLDNGDHSEYMKLAANTYHLQVSRSDSGTVVLDQATLTFLSQQNYTVILSGSIEHITPVAVNLKAYFESGL